MSSITFLGTADAFNSGGRGHSCYWVEDDLGHYLVDFGPTALMQCERLNIDLNKLDGVFLTHLHGDHIGGLAMLLLYLHFKLERTRPLVIAGPAETDARLALLRESAYPSLVRRGLCFPLELRHWAVPGTIEVLGRSVTTIRAAHDRLATATSFRVEGGGKALAFSGDTGWQPALPQLVNGADLFVCECSMVSALYDGHLSIEEIAEHRDEFEVGRLVLSHMSEESRAALGERGEAMGVVVADDGLTLDI